MVRTERLLPNPVPVCHMPTPGHNEADTRAKLIDPALHKAYWVEQVTATERETHGEIRREQSAVRIEILDGKALKRGKGRVDYLLCSFVGGHEHPLTLAFVEAKKEKLPPTHGMEQVKEYARRFTVKFVYSRPVATPLDPDDHQPQSKVIAWRRTKTPTRARSSSTS